MLTDTLPDRFESAEEAAVQAAGAERPERSTAGPSRGAGSATASASDRALLSELRASGVPEAVDRAELQRRLGLSSEYLAGRLLAALDPSGRDAIPREELVRRVEGLIEGPPAARLEFVFRVHDEDGDGFVDRGELLRMLHITLAENALVFGDEMIEALADALLGRADTDGDGRVSLPEFTAALEHYPGVLEQLTLGDVRWLGLGPTDAGPRAAPVGRRLASALRSRGPWIALMLVYAAATLGLMVEAFLRYRSEGAPLPIQIARAGGAALNLHGALLLVPMCRRLFTWLGQSAIGRMLIDDHVAFHRLIGNVALWLGVGHGAAHLVNALALAGGLTTLLTWAGITGAILLAVHLVIWAFARDVIRRSGRFELFHWTHRLYPVWVGLLLLHGPAAWKWMAAPIALFAIDRFLLRRVATTVATSVEPLPSRVTRLTVVRPGGFEPTAGDYAYLCVPSLARSEWHPFTISSAPERRDAFTLHVRTVGNWTAALRRLAEARGDDAPPVPVKVDGPYGSASSDVFGSRFVLLVAAGIGVTPFAAVLSSMLERIERRRELAVERVCFVWVCREQRSFEWFSDVLGRLEAADPARFDVRIFMDAGRSDVRSAVLRVAMDALFADVRADLVTGLRSRTTLGPPDWAALVSEVAARHAPAPVDCFYCGPPGLARAVRDACAGAGVSFRQEHF